MEERYSRHELIRMLTSEVHERWRDDLDENCDSPMLAEEVLDETTFKEMSDDLLLETAINMGVIGSDATLDGEEEREDE